MNGVYDGDLSVYEIKDHGDIGLGTFNALDGEMVILDGVVYKVGSDGLAHAMDDDVLSPFVCVTTFDVDKKIEIDQEISLEQVQELIESNLPSPNLMYAIKIEGRFVHMRTRSPKAQIKPYPDLIEALSDQSVFNFHEVGGTVVGFWYPSFVEEINVTGYHFHFITDSRDAGGHVLDMTIEEGTVYIDYSYCLELDLPSKGEYLSLELDASNEDIEKVEK
jgi:acetolactate decarboxylase